MGRQRGIKDGLLPAGLAVLLAPLGGTPIASAAVLSPAPDTGCVMLRHDGADIYLAERGGSFAKLDLGDTAESRALLVILRQVAPEGADIVVPVDGRIVADGGASVRKGGPRKSGAARSRS
jgi:hypothetical protein